MSRLPRELFFFFFSFLPKQQTSPASAIPLDARRRDSVYTLGHRLRILFFPRPGVRCLSLIPPSRTPPTRWISIIASMSLRASETLHDTSMLRYNGISIGQTERSESRQRWRRRNGTALDVLEGAGRYVERKGSWRRKVHQGIRQRRDQRVIHRSPNNSQLSRGKNKNRRFARAEDLRSEDES